MAILVCLRRAKHRDLKSENLMVRRMPDGSSRLVAADFGLAKQTASTNPTHGEYHDYGGTADFYVSDLT